MKGFLCEYLEYSLQLVMNKLGEFYFFDETFHLHSIKDSQVDTFESISFPNPFVPLRFRKIKLSLSFFLAPPLLQNLPKKITLLKFWKMILPQTPKKEQFFENWTPPALTVDLELSAKLEKYVKRYYLQC